MSILPNPFQSAVAPEMVADSAAAPCLTDPTVAAADQFDGADIPLTELIARGFDPDGFVSDCEPLPAFLSAPSQQYLNLKAADLVPVLMTLAGH